MDFAFDATTLELRDRLLAFMEECVYPAEPRFREEAEHSDDRWGTPPVIEELKTEARERGLWNLFLPAIHEDGAGLTNLQYAPLAEITGRNPWMAPEALNCSAPDTGNMELLSLFATPEQKARWLDPLLDGRIRSAFSMTEPDVASSDATNIATRIQREGDDYVINGRKWWTSGAMAPRCELLIVMGVTDPDAERHRRQSMILVPKDTPGVRVERSTSLFGYDDGPHGGHAEIVYDNVRVPASNLLGDEGDGFRLAQERLGPGRIHHAMRAIGMAERALEMMCRRTASRSAFGRPIVDHGVVQRWISESRVKIEQVRLLVLKTAWLMDTVGNRGARIEVSAIKVAAPEVATWVIDRAIQAHGGAGVSQDHLLAELYAVARILQIADGPDEVHHMAIARRETRRYREPVPVYLGLRGARPGRRAGALAAGRRRDSAVAGLHGQAGHGEAPRDVEVRHLGEREPAVGPVPVKDAVVEPEDRAREQPRVGLGDRALLHPARQERRPLELEVAGAGAGQLPRLLLTGGRPVHPDQHLLGHEQTVAQELVLRQVEGRLEHRVERLGEVLVPAGDAVELLHLGFERLGHDLVETVELGLEVVIERRRPDPDDGGHVGPLAVLVPLPAEQLGRGLQDRRALAP